MPIIIWLTFNWSRRSAQTAIPQAVDNENYWVIKIQYLCYNL